MRSQSLLITGNTEFIQKQKKLARTDLSIFVNTSASNAGIAEAVRDEALFAKPHFVTKGEKEQIARLQQQLQLWQQRKEPQVQGIIARDKVDKKGIITHGGEAAGTVLGKTYEEAKIGKILADISRESATQIDRQQAQIERQLDALADNRLRRHFQTAKMQARPPQLERPPQQQRPRSRVGAGRLYDTYGYGGGYGGYGGAVGQGPVPRQPASEVPQLLQPALPGAEVAYTPRAVPQGFQPYVAKGIYSLPVTLPEGEIRLDFARPAGEAKISIWAVPLSTIRSLYATVAVMIALLAVLGIVKIWPQPTERRPLSIKRIIIYLVTLVAVTLILGLLGFLVSILVVLLCEAKRGAFAAQPIS